MDLEVWHSIYVEWPFDLEEKVNVNKFNRLESSMQVTWISFYVVVSKTSMVGITCVIIGCITT